MDHMIYNSFGTTNLYFDYFKYLSEEDIACYNYSIGNSSYLYPCPFLTSTHLLIQIMIPSLGIILSIKFGKRRIRWLGIWIKYISILFLITLLILSPMEPTPSLTFYSHPPQPSPSNSTIPTKMQELD